MLSENNRALKEWAIACEAMREGRQIVLIRKGGLREPGFEVHDREFFLMPTYEHQDPELLQQEWADRLHAGTSMPADHNSINLSAYAIVDSVHQVTDDSRLPLLSGEHIWNDRYLQIRVDFNAYDPLYILILRVFNLTTPWTLPLLRPYKGCKSWVTLDRSLPIENATAAIPDAEFDQRRDAILGIIEAR